jgi:LysM repeat protein
MFSYTLKAENTRSQEVGIMRKVANAVVTLSAFALLAVFLVSAAAVAVKLLWTDGALREAGTERVYTEVVVKPGDTLWVIAQQQMPDHDPRDAVAKIRELNQLPSAQIYPGQTLTLEVKRPAEAQHMAQR